MGHTWTIAFYAALLAIFPTVSGRTIAQGPSKEVPLNGLAKPYGRGWECKPGFRQDGTGCVAVKLPENAYLSDSSYGPGWECRYGYKQEGSFCTAVKVPQNAYLTESRYGEGMRPRLSKG